MKFRVVEDCRDAWPVQALCRVLGISTAGYYAWRSRPDSKRVVENSALLADIRQAHADSGGRYGVTPQNGQDSTVGGTEHERLR